jgi:hypothetical protein
LQQVLSPLVKMSLFHGPALNQLALLDPPLVLSQREQGKQFLAELSRISFLSGVCDTKIRYLDDLTSGRTCDPVDI